MFDSHAITRGWTDATQTPAQADVITAAGIVIAFLRLVG